MASVDELQAAMRGVGITPITPFTADLAAVDVGALRSNIEFLIEAGATLLYPAGNTGEFSSLSLEEWTEVVEAVLSVAGDRCTVAPGIGHGYSTSREMMRRAASLGASGVLVMPPQLTFVADEGLIAFYTGLAEDSSLPTVVYKRDGRPSDEALGEMLRHAPIAGVKYSDTDVNGLVNARRAGPKHVAWSCGLAERYAPFFHMAGTVGFTSGLANFAPQRALAMQAALEEDDLGTALTIREECVPFENIRARDRSANNVSAVKTAMSALGLGGGRVRPPLRDLDGTTEEEVRALVLAWAGSAAA